MPGGEGCQGGGVLWEMGEEATVGDGDQEEPRHLASVFLLFNGDKNVYCACMGPGSVM